MDPGECFWSVLFGDVLVLMTMNNIGRSKTRLVLIHLRPFLHLCACIVMQLANLESEAKVHRARRSPVYDLDCPHHFLVSISPGAQGWPANQLISAPRGLSVWGWEVATIQASEERWAHTRPSL